MSAGKFKIKSPLISIITATFNAANNLPRLIESLSNQTNKNFEWVVADAVSIDDTLMLLSQAKNVDVVVDSRPDFGIYDAINRAIKISSGDYYLVVGSDDILYPDSIEMFYTSLEKELPDFVSAQVRTDCGVMIFSKKKWKWFYSQRAYIGAHAVGTLIRKSLHDRFGFYSKDFPIAADQLFIKMACDAGARIVYTDFVSGVFSTSGVSSLDRVGLLTESFRVQLRTGECKFLQLCLLFARLINNYKYL